jgi:hypothetical protein
MPYELTWEHRGVYRRYFGDVTIVERRHSLDSIFANPRFDSLRFTITDYLDVDSYEITDEATEEIAAMHVAPLLTNPRIVIAAVTVDERIIAAIKHFISLDFIRQPYRVFPSVAAARHWIGVESLGFVPPTPRRARGWQ